MFNMLSNLTKAVVSVAVVPVAVVADTIMLIPDCENHKGEFSRTGKLLKNAGACLDEATKPDPTDV